MADPLVLLGRFVKPGDLVFDIGAHEGKHTGWLLELGAQVVACEPQPEFAAAIPSHERLTVLPCAVSDHIGSATLYPAPGHEYVSTLEPAYLELVQAHASYTYADAYQVPCTTLDALIDEYGEPVFCKVDVEGHERAVFAGLSRALPALSFEVHDFEPDKTEDVLTRLAELGRYDLFYSGREWFEPEPWPAQIDVFGDIYAVLQ